MAGDAVYQSVLAAHRRTLDRLIDRGAVGRLKSVYDRATAEVLAKLTRLGRGSQSFTEQHLRMILAQLKAGQIHIDDKMAHTLSTASREAQVDSLNSLVRGYKKLEAHFTGHEPVLPLEEVARFAGVIDKRHGSLLRQHKTSMNRYGSAVVGSVQEELAVSLATGETLDGAIFRVHETVEGEWWQAERIARTECSYAANIAHSDGIAELAEEAPGLEQQWIEFCDQSGHPLDDRVGVDSIAMHGQLTPPGGVFEMPPTAPFPDAKGKVAVSPSLVGQTWAVPPCRPNGREMVQPWRKAWGTPGWHYRNGRRVPA